MKKHITPFVFFLFSFMSCEKDDVAIANLTENTTINNEETYEFLIGRFFDSSVAEIQIEPVNDLISEIKYEEDSQLAYYVYRPKTDYIGRETIKIYFKNFDFQMTGKNYLTIKLEVTD